MKKVLFLLSLIILSCDGDSRDFSSEETNQAPTVPVLLYPSNNLLCIDNQIIFQWSPSTDFENDAINYTIQVSTDNLFHTVDFMTNISAATQTFDLNQGVAYYWRVKATDTNNASSDYSSTFNFVTEGDRISNHLPFSPELVNPVLNSQVNSGTVNLEWSASDTDGDALTYTIYFGTQNPPTTIISENQNGSSINISTLIATTYYWKVIVKDEHEGQTIGQIWHFNTN